MMTFVSGGDLFLAGNVLLPEVDPYREIDCGFFV
jgi:hypothetical protein